MKPLDAPSYLAKLSFIVGGWRRDFLVLFGAFLALSVLDLLSVGLVGPFIALVVDPSRLDSLPIGQAVHALLPDAGNYALIACFGMGFLVLFYAKTLGAAWINWRILHDTHQLGAELSERLARAYQAAPYEFLLKRNRLDLVKNATLHVGQLTTGTLFVLLRLLSEFVVIVAIVVFLAWVNFAALLLLAVLMGASSWVYDRFFGRHTGQWGRAASEAHTLMTRNLTETLEGFKEIRVLGVERQFYDEFSRGAQMHAMAYEKNQFFIQLPRFFLEASLVTFVVLLSGISLLSGTASSDLIPLLGMLGLSALRILPSAFFILSGLGNLRFSGRAIDHVYADLREIEGLQQEVGKSREGRQHAFERMELRAVSFSYAGTAVPVLNDVSLVLERGYALGIVGASGAGKSTLVDLMLGFLPPSGGQVCVNGADITLDRRSWLDRVAYIPQFVFMKDDSLCANIALGVPAEQIDRDRLLDVVQRAQLADFVASLPAGLDTQIGDRGIRISGGQRQRVAIARALYHDREILIFDEATSALDNETEKEIVKSIETLRGEKTLVVIAHRLSTITGCDRVIQVENGSLREISPAMVGIASEGEV